MTPAKTEPVEHTISTRGGDVRLIDAGSGPVLVMLHGGGPGASGVSNYHQNLDALGSRFRVLLPDQPGFGRSYRPTEIDLAEKSITQITVDALIEVLDKLGLETFNLLGNSLGGAAAIALAQQYPDRVARLVLMAPGGGWLPFGPTPTEGQKEMFRYFNGEGPTLKKMRTFISVMTAEPKRWEDTAQARYEASLEPSHVEFYHRLNRHFTSRHGMDPLWHDLNKIKSPTLLLWGRDDRTITLEGAHMMLKYISDVQLHVFGNCGHWVQLERQAEFERLVQDFLS
ncbi:alpha/beta fold hydrolase [Nocardioides sp. LS1]|uniref:alpha/beta fold hydrolase n=1 Tax=Nocardioides sp. LS1 TaxID=1027620 RepID=UPI000FFAE7A9|nr:alpha/beta fold hydrolase [Nocardioides sp. LS1]GCD88636.1 putative hydrolase, alpha/beta fold protein [Nocardioides sp. LS1]